MHKTQLVASCQFVYVYIAMFTVYLFGCHETPHRPQIQVTVCINKKAAQYQLN